jgi:hypothetical protein
MVMVPVFIWVAGLCYTIRVRARRRRLLVPGVEAPSGPHENLRLVRIKF